MNLPNTFWDNIKKIKLILSLEDIDIAHMLTIKEREYANIKQLHQIPSVENVISLCRSLGVSLDNFFENKLDLIQIRNQYFGAVYDLPSRYDYGKLSKSRTVTNCLDFLDLKYGEGLKKSLLRSMQIDPRFFESQDRDMNINVLTDLCEHLRKLGFTDTDYKQLGQRSYDVNKNTDLGKKLSSYNSVYDLFEDVCTNLSTKFDQNFTYNISKMKAGEIYIESRPTEIAQDLMHTNNIGNHLVCQTKLGVFGSFPKYLGIYHSDAVKTKCIYDTDSVIEYRVTF